MTALTDRERLLRAAELLDAWGSAIRMDWGTIDGRSCCDELGSLAAFMRGSGDTITAATIGVCMGGALGPHWDDGCHRDEEARP